MLRGGCWLGSDTRSWERRSGGHQRKKPAAVILVSGMPSQRLHGVQRPIALSPLSQRLPRGADVRILAGAAAPPGLRLVRRLVLSEHIRGDAPPVGDLQALSASPRPDVGLVMPGRTRTSRCALR